MRCVFEWREFRTPRPLQPGSCKPPPAIVLAGITNGRVSFRGDAQERFEAIYMVFARANAPACDGVQITVDYRLGLVYQLVRAVPTVR